MHDVRTVRAAGRGGGAIVNIASNGGLYAIQTAPAYVAAKHGIVGLTKVAAVDYAPDNIRVNAVCPGPTRTPGFEEVAAGTDMIARQAAITPLGRLATLEESPSGLPSRACTARQYRCA